MKQDLYYPSSDGCTTIHAVCWYPEGEVKGILQIVHGMQEYIDRYDEYAAFLNSHGFCVVGEDHLGHGASVTSPERLGYFADQQGNECVIKDIHTLHEQFAQANPGLPYFFLGHSMGSFLTRQYIQRYGNELSGAVIMGTGTKPQAVLSFGKFVTKLLARFKGWDSHSNLVDTLAFGAYNKKIKDLKTKHDWLSRNPDNVSRYEADPLCMFRFTVNGYYNMFCSMEEAIAEKKIAQVPKNLPILLTSGDADPVGEYGKGVTFAYNQFRKAGIADLEMRMYPEDRHEILNEVDRQQVYEDILAWFLSHIA